MGSGQLSMYCIVLYCIVKTVLSEEIPVNKYHKKINLMSKLVEKMLVILKC